MYVCMCVWDLILDSPRRGPVMGIWVQAVHLGAFPRKYQLVMRQWGWREENADIGIEPGERNESLVLRRFALTYILQQHEKCTSNKVTWNKLAVLWQREIQLNATPSLSSQLAFRNCQGSGLGCIIDFRSVVKCWVRLSKNDICGSNWLFLFSLFNNNCGPWNGQWYLLLHHRWVFCIKEQKTLGLSGHIGVTTARVRSTCH